MDGSENLTDEDTEILNHTNDVTRLIAINKIDLPSANLQFSDTAVVRISAKTSTGLDELEEAIVAPFAQQEIENKGFLVTDARHFDLLQRATADIENSIKLLDQKMSEEIVLIGLHNGIRYLGEITGETTTEDMLSRIFSTFCIGK